MSIFSLVKSKISILDVALEYVKLKQIGGYWKGSCPLHNETDASFTVSPDKQIFYCFGCHAGGDVIAFVEKIENLSPIQAVNHLVDKYNIELPEDIKTDFTKSWTKKEQFFNICNEVAILCYDNLQKNSMAKSYIEQRGFGSEEQKRFMIGYFPCSQGFNQSGSRSLNIFIKELSKKNILVQDLIETGIIFQNGLSKHDSIYSPFEDRIIFPIKDVLGRCCGFGGRVFRQNDERAKYYNSKESDLFLKGKLLFGLDLAKREMQTQNKAFLVEGYTDCVAMVKHGYKNTVATLGTACTVEHLKILSRYINTLFVLYDGDNAGQNAILRLTKLCWDVSLELQIIKLPSNQDPASFLNSGGSIDTLIETSCDIFTFFVGSLGQKFWGKTLLEKMELCDKIIKVVSKIDDNFKRDILLQKAAHVMQTPFESLQLMVRKQKNKNEVKEKKQLDKNDEKKLVNNKYKDILPLESKIVSIVVSGIVNNKNLNIEDDLLPYFSEFTRSILEKVKKFDNKGDKSGEVFDKLLHCFDDVDDRDWIIKNSFDVCNYDEDGASSICELLEKLVFRFRKNKWRNIVQDMKQKIFEAKMTNDKDKLQQLLHSFSSLKQEMKQRGLI
jgi:DNA primase